MRIIALGGRHGAIEALVEENAASPMRLCAFAVRLFAHRAL
jgi:hypothetical protein